MINKLVLLTGFFIVISFLFCPLLSSRFSLLNPKLFHHRLNPRSFYFFSNLGIKNVFFLRSTVSSFEDIDQLVLFRPLCKFVARVTRLREIVPTLRQAILTAQEVGNISWTPFLGFRKQPGVNVYPADDPFVSVKRHNSIFGYMFCNVVFSLNYMADLCFELEWVFAFTLSVQPDMTKPFFSIKSISLGRKQKKVQCWT